MAKRRTHFRRQSGSQWHIEMRNQGIGDSGHSPSSISEAKEMMRTYAETILMIRTAAGTMLALKEWAEGGLGTPLGNWHFKTIVRSASLVDLLS